EGREPVRAGAGELEAPLKGALVRLGTTRLRHAGAVEGVAFLAGGTKLISWGGQGDWSVRIWDAATGKEGWKEGLPAGTRALAVSRDGRLLATGGDDRVVRLWEAASRPLRVLQQFQVHQAVVTCLAFTPDDRVVSGSADGSVRLWDQPSGKETHQ